MKKWLSLILTAAALVCLCCGCKATPQQHTIELESNPTTGYTWAYKADTEGIVKEISSDYIADDADEDVSGAGGVDQWVFEAVAPGTVVLSFVYSQSWEEEGEPDNAVDITLVVNKDLSIDETAIEWLDGTVG